MSTVILKPPKKEVLARNQDLRYEHFVGREDVRRASVNLKRVVAANAVVVASLGCILLYVVIANLNRGDYIFPTGQRTGEYFAIPWLGWHAWLESVSWTLGFVAGAGVIVAVANIAVHLYYRFQVPDRQLQEFLHASAMANRDDETRRLFKERYASIYQDMLDGKAVFTQAAAPGPAPGPTTIKATVPLPQIKMPPKVAIAPPGTVSLPPPAAVAPPIPGQIAKKKPTGPVEGEKKIYVRCERCNKTLPVNIPKNLVLDNELEVVPVSIVHGEGASRHVLTVFLDPDFKSRRDRVSDLLFYSD